MTYDECAQNVLERVAEVLNDPSVSRPVALVELKLLHDATLPHLTPRQRSEYDALLEDTMLLAIPIRTGSDNYGD